jgi:hypothetical protein
MSHNEHNGNLILSTQAKLHLTEFENLNSFFACFTTLRESFSAVRIISHQAAKHVKENQKKV